ncbi:DUF6020 family protein [uncultured Bifidobacterium sp.]|uniref:DUF6020 family protein n=1 Tax=uncultured Bifidobacterium sp. TaxID=165187 RepID=UPI0025910177|nr:DUF6020 family protein [uncultured Bifidobacterium sp.]
MKRMPAVVESPTVRTSTAQRKLRLPRFGLFCCSLVLAALAEYCAYLNEGGGGNVRRVLHIIALTVFFMVMTLIFERFIDWLGRDSKRTESDHDRSTILSGFLRRITPDFAGDRRQTLKAIAVMAVCWLPYYMLALPGEIWYDTVQQVMMWKGLPNPITSGAWSDHHPVLDTLIFGVFYQLGAWLGHPAVGVALYTTCIAIAAIVVFVYTVRYLAKSAVSKRAYLGAYLFFCLFPFIPIFSMAMVKDAVFLPLFMLFSIQCMEVARTKGACLKNRQTLTVLIVLAILVSLTKKTGVYSVVLACILLAFVVAGNQARVKLLAPAAASGLVIFVLLPLALFPACHIIPGGKQEMIAIPLQQSALLLREHGDELPKAEKDVLTGILEPDAAENYEWWAVDKVKGTHWTEQRARLLHPFLRIWAKNAVKYPETYARAYFLLEQGWVALPNAIVNENLQSNYLYMRTAPSGNVVASGLPQSKRTRLYDGIDEFVIGLGNQFFMQPWLSRAFWVTWLPVMQLYETIRKLRAKELSWAYAAWLIPMLVSVPFMWISGCSVSPESIRGQ